MRLNEAVEKINRIRPILGRENNEALDVILEELYAPRMFEIKLDEKKVSEMIHDVARETSDCVVCLRQGCEYRDAEVVRVNCPLLKTSAV